jgi:NAD dependent epimerase/dehydratase family enzyme
VLPERLVEHGFAFAFPDLEDAIDEVVRRSRARK